MILAQSIGIIGIGIDKCIEFNLLIATFADSLLNEYGK
jgi:hypothetical protein